MPRDNRLTIIAAAVLITICIWAYALLPGRGTLDVTVMDVGEGLCVVVCAPSGKVMVVDCGTSSWRNSESVGRSVVAPYLHRLGKDSIDVAVLSHPHSDHVSGYAGLLKVVPAKLVLDIGAKHKSSFYRRFLREARKCGAIYRIAKRGQRIEMGDGVVVEVLSPAAGEQYSDLNNNAIVLRVVYGKAAIMLATDACDETERKIMDSCTSLRAQALLVGHHGGRGACSDEWLAAVRPSIAVISCGRRNYYGHPSRETVNRLESSGARVYRTDRDGAITVSTDGRTMRATAFSSAH
ncbi:MAG: ComEC/Rec2 family competence protein [Armatimonadota bacterium]|nr:MBL fold metallo-hydrolase [bacterium]